MPMPSRPNRRKLLGQLASLGTLGPLAAATAWAQKDKPLVLGQSAAVSGPAAQLGLQVHAGARLHFDALNAQGGIHGRMVELKLLDDGYEPARCKANTEAFIRDEVFALFGYVGTPTALAALPLVNQERMPFFAPVTGAQALRDPLSRQVFHVRASYFDETALIVRQLTQLGLKKIAVFRQNDSYGQAGFDGVQRALAPKGLEVVAVGLVERNSVDVAAAVAAIVPKQPDAVIQVGAYQGCAAFVRAARKAGYGGSFYNLSFVGTQALADALGKDARGVMVSQVMPFPFNTTHGLARDYLDAVAAARLNATPDGKNAGAKAQAGMTPNYSGMEGYVAARVLSEGLKRAGRNPSRDALLSALEDLPRLDIGGFAVGFGPRQHVGSQFVELTLLTEDGKVRR